MVHSVTNVVTVLGLVSNTQHRAELSLADRAWETDDNESLMLSTGITNKVNRCRTV